MVSQKTTECSKKEGNGQWGENPRVTRRRSTSSVELPGGWKRGRAGKAALQERAACKFLPQPLAYVSLTFHLAVPDLYPL